MDHLIRAICQKEGLRPGVIQPLQGGQVNQVYRIDHDYVLRIGEREGAFQRLKSETGLLQSLAGELPVPEIVAFGEQEDKAYQIQKFVPGQKLHIPPERMKLLSRNELLNLVSFIFLFPKGNNFRNR